MVAIDASVLMLLLQPGAGVPVDAEGKPVERAAERVQHLVAELDLKKETVLVPTPALAEVLVRLDDRQAERLVERIGRYLAMRIAPFDLRAAVEVAAMTRDALGRGDGKGDAAATYAKLKYDRQIVAIAKVNRATVIYSDDAGMGRVARRSGIDVVGVAGLPLPPGAGEPERGGDDRLPLFDVLDDAR